MVLGLYIVRAGTLMLQAWVSSAMATPNAWTAGPVVVRWRAWPHCAPNPLGSYTAAEFIKPRPLQSTA